MQYIFNAFALVERAGNLWQSITIRAGTENWGNIYIYADPNWHKADAKDIRFYLPKCIC